MKYAESSAEAPVIVCWSPWIKGFGCAGEPLSEEQEDERFAARARSRSWCVRGDQLTGQGESVVLSRSGVVSWR